MDKWEVYIQEQKPGFALVRIAKNCIHGRVFYFSQPGGRAAAIAEAERLCAEWNAAEEVKRPLKTFSIPSENVGWGDLTICKINDKNRVEFTGITLPVKHIDAFVEYLTSCRDTMKEADEKNICARCERPCKGETCVNCNKYFNNLLDKNGDGTGR